MSLNTLLFEHLRHFTLVVGRLEATGEFTLGTMNATVRNEHREVRFQAQYLVRKPKGNLTYSPMFTPDVEGFIGWLPYFNRRWEEGFDKLAFKRRCERLGLPVPAWSADRIEPALGDVVIKAARGSSFGHGVRGPYRASDAAAMSLHPGEYAEAFVPGQIGKVWYWGERVVALELSDPAHAVGDGISSLAALVRRARRSANIEAITDFFRYSGLSWDRVPAAGETVVLDFKYGSAFAAWPTGSTNRVAELDGTPLMAQLREWGPVFWGFVERGDRRPALYTVDFILAPAAGIRLLEMNCNPMVPVEAYDAILGSAFDPALPPYDGPLAPGAMIETSVPALVEFKPPVAMVTPPPATASAATVLLFQDAGLPN